MGQACAGASEETWTGTNGTHGGDQPVDDPMRERAGAVYVPVWMCECMSTCCCGGMARVRYTVVEQVQSSKVRWRRAAAESLELTHQQPRGERRGIPSHDLHHRNWAPVANQCSRATGPVAAPPEATAASSKSSLHLHHTGARSRLRRPKVALGKGNMLRLQLRTAVAGLTWSWPIRWPHTLQADAVPSKAVPSVSDLSLSPVLKLFLPLII